MLQNLCLIIRADIAESVRSKWFLLYSVVFGGLVALFFITGVTESRIQGFSGLSRLLLIFIETCIVILPIFILISTVRTIAADRENSVLEYLLSFPISLKEYYFGRFVGRLISAATPVLAALLLSLVWAALKGVDIPWGLFFYYTFLIIAIIVSFLGFSFFISSVVKSQEIALGTSFVLWLLLLAFIDILLIGILSRGAANTELIFSIAILNPLQVFRIGAISLFDPELTVIGPAAYFLLDNFGKTFFMFYALFYPILLGLIFTFIGFFCFKKRDLV